MPRDNRSGAWGGHVDLEVSVRESGDVRIVDARGMITLGEETDRLNRDLQFLIEHGWRKILVNIADVAKMDSAGISTLARTSMALTKAGGSLKLVCPAGRVREALELTRLTNSIPTFDDEATALESFR